MRTDNEMHDRMNARMQQRHSRSRALVHWGILALSIGTGACAKAHATTPKENPPLDMPAPPPREVEPLDTETPPPMPLQQEPARNAPPRPRPAPTRPEPARPPQTPAAEPPKPDPQPPAESPKPEEPPKPTPPLQTAPAASESESERAIRATIARANTDLNRVDAARLNAGARTQYDNARSLLRQAESAVHAKNLVFAKTVAEKAAALAAQLAPK